MKVQGNLFLIKIHKNKFHTFLLVQFTCTEVPVLISINSLKNFI